MDEKKIILILLGIVGIAFLTWFFKRLKANQDEIKALILNKFPKERILLQDPLALHIAQESHGYSQSRGNGSLILTREELFFAMAMPKKIISIPIGNLIDIERVQRMGGKCIMKPILKIRFRDAQGSEDALGFHLKQMEQWEGQLRKLLSV